MKIDASRNIQCRDQRENDKPNIRNQWTMEASIATHSTSERQETMKIIATNQGPETMDNHQELAKANQQSLSQT